MAPERELKQFHFETVHSMPGGLRVFVIALVFAGMPGCQAEIDLICLFRRVLRMGNIRCIGWLIARPGRDLFVSVYWVRLR